MQAGLRVTYYIVANEGGLLFLRSTNVYREVRLTRWLLSDLVNATSIYNSDDEQVHPAYTQQLRKSIAPVLSHIFFFLNLGPLFSFFLVCSVLFFFLREENSRGSGGMCRASPIRFSYFYTTTTPFPIVEIVIRGQRRGFTVYCATSSSESPTRHIRINCCFWGRN